MGTSNEGLFRACSVTVVPEMQALVSLPRLRSNGARSPEGTSIWFRATEKNGKIIVVRPAAHSCCAQVQIGKLINLSEIHFFCLFV